MTFHRFEKKTPHNKQEMFLNHDQVYPEERHEAQRSNIELQLWKDSNLIMELSETAKEIRFVNHLCFRPVLDMLELAGKKNVK